MIEGTTTSGFAFSLENDALDDYELLEALRAVDNGDSAAVVDVADALLGKKQKEALKEHLRQENGRVSATTMVTAVYEILSSIQAGKNS